MLVELHIENLGVIESAILQIQRGFTVLTGETGAGKTMLIEAINLVVGARADASVVRSGAEEARVEALFHVEKNGVEEEFILTRVVPLDGRSRAYINGRPTTVAMLSEVGADLVDIHGQHAHQKLLSASAQREALDQFAGIDVSPIRDARSRMVEIDAAMASLGGDERMRAREIDLLTFQCEEIEAAGVTNVDEEAILALEEETLADAVNIRESLWRAVDLISADDGAIDKVGSSIAALGSQKIAEDVLARLQSIAAELDDALLGIRDLAERIEEDPKRLEAVRVRRQLVRDLMKKYGDTLSDVVTYGADSRARLNELIGYSERIAELEQERLEALEALKKQQTKVGKARRKAAGSLGQAITSRLQTLAMEHAEVVVHVSEDPEDLAGDNVVFLLSANPGSPLLPLTKVASGGELARTMLALRLTLSTDPATMVFDEVDAGIGGSAAVSVAQALAELGSRHQVLAVTHMAQMAAAASNHVNVTKEIVEKKTFGRAKVLDSNERVEEIARMLSGGLADDTALRHAEEMLKASDFQK